MFLYVELEFENKNEEEILDLPEEINIEEDFSDIDCHNIVSTGGKCHCFDERSAFLSHFQLIFFISYVVSVISVTHYNFCFCKGMIEMDEE